MSLFSFFIFSDRWSLKVENENKNSKTLTAKVSYMRLEFRLYIETYPGWLELLLARTMARSPDGIWATGVLLYICFIIIANAFVTHVGVYM